MNQTKTIKQLLILHELLDDVKELRKALKSNPQAFFQERGLIVPRS